MITSQSRKAARLERDCQSVRFCITKLDFNCLQGSNINMKISPLLVCLILATYCNNTCCFPRDRSAFFSRVQPTFFTATAGVSAFSSLIIVKTVCWCSESDRVCAYFILLGRRELNVIYSSGIFGRTFLVAKAT